MACNALSLLETLLSCFRQVVTYDASPEAGAAEHCRANVHSFFQTVLAKKESSSFWRQLAEVFGLCQAPESATDVENVAYWIQVWFHVCLALHHVACSKKHIRCWPCFLLSKTNRCNHA
jgi:hypothetical protein